LKIPKEFCNNRFFGLNSADLFSPNEAPGNKQQKSNRKAHKEKNHKDRKQSAGQVQPIGTQTFRAKRLKQHAQIEQ